MWTLYKSNSHSSFNNIHRVGDFFLEYSFPKRFNGDCLYEDNSNFTLLIEGILFNSREVFGQKLTNIYNKLSPQQMFFSKLNGAFSGFIYFKTTKELYIFTCQNGLEQVFSYNSDFTTCFSNDYHKIVEFLHSKNIEIKTDIIGLKNLYSFGYCVGSSTLGGGISRLEPGECILINNFKTSKQFYHEYGRLKITEDYNQAIEEVDRLFKQAVSRCFDKDLEYGFNNHLVDISGGFDCKLISWVAHTLGYKNILNITYSKYGSDEMYAATQSAIQMHNDCIYKPLDDCGFFFDYNHLVRKNCGLSVFCSSTGADSLLKIIDFDKYGLEHTGLLGDVIVGSYCKNLNDQSKDMTDCFNSISYFPSKQYEVVTNREYRCYEQLAIYFRGMQGITNSCLIRNEYTKTVSAFMDLDFMDYCLSLPVEWRMGHKLYKDWLRIKYPDFLSLPSTRSLSASPKKTLRKIIVKSISPWKSQIKKMLLKNGFAGVVEGRNSMNPVNLWFSENKDIALDWNSLFNSINSIPCSEEVRKLTVDMYNTSSAMGKAAVITYLTWFKEFVEDKKSF